MSPMPPPSLPILAAAPEAKLLPKESPPPKIEEISLLASKKEFVPGCPAAHSTHQNNFQHACEFAHNIPPCAALGARYFLLHRATSEHEETLGSGTSSPSSMMCFLRCIQVTFPAGPQKWSMRF